MVAVVVVDGCALKKAEKLETAMRTGESFERGNDIRKPDSDLERHRGGSGGVLDVVASALAQVDAPELAAAVMDGKGASVFTAVVRAGVEAVGDLAPARGERARARIVRAKHRNAVGRQPADELREKRLHRVDVGEVVGVVE